MASKSQVREFARIMKYRQLHGVWPEDANKKILRLAREGEAICRRSCQIDAGLTPEARRQREALFSGEDPPTSKNRYLL
ncbi:hypothetical protein JCM15519_02940 [Fundidesulfovibrio butyratiphilus]